MTQAWGPYETIGTKESNDGKMGMHSMWLHL
jgi:hypothetical protein